MNFKSKKVTIVISTLTRAAVICTIALAVLAFTICIQAQDLVMNGDFLQTTCASSCVMNNTNVADWQTTSGFTFEVYPGQATIDMGNGYKLWQASDPPFGSNFLVSDGAFAIGAETQMVSVTAGQTYDVSFWQAAGQLYGFNGATTEYWQVCLGTLACQDSTPTMMNPSHGFQAWNSQSLSFTANTTGSVPLSFEAVGTPPFGEPPMVLLADVSMYNATTPEPGTLVMTLGGLLGVVVTLRSKKWSKR